jgi:hypothetical protein
MLKLNEAVIERVMATTTTEDLLAIWEEVKGTGLISYRVRPDLFRSDLFAALEFTEQQAAIVATLDKNQLYVNLYDLDDANCAVSELDRQFTQSFYAPSAAAVAGTSNMADAAGAGTAGAASRSAEVAVAAVPRKRRGGPDEAQPA